MYEEFKILLLKLTHIFLLLQEMRGEMKRRRFQPISGKKETKAIFKVGAMFKQNGKIYGCLAFCFILLILSCSEEKAKNTSSGYCGITETSEVLIQIIY